MLMPRSLSEAGPDVCAVYDVLNILDDRWEAQLLNNCLLGQVR